MLNLGRKKTYILLLVFVAAAAVLFFVKGRQKSYRSSVGMVWTTEYHITYQSDADLDDSIQVALMSVDNSLSQFNKNSLVSRINSNETKDVDRMFVEVYAASERIWKETRGAFDPTVSPLVNAWGFGFKSGEMPDSVSIDSIRQYVGFEKTTLRDREIKKLDSRIAFDFSAIAKGYGCDEVGRMFRRNGVENYMVEIGGEIALNGVNPRGEEWHISVDQPIESNDSVIHQSALVLKIGTGGIATSGNYRNFKIENGRKVAHTINPKTGYPELSRLLSVTIVADNCMNADGYATACMVMGLDRSKAYLENNRELGALLIFADDNGKLIQWSNQKFRQMTVEN